MADTGRHNARSAAIQAQRQATRAITKSARKKRDNVSDSSQGVRYWNGLFMGWETADADLCGVQLPDGTAVIHFVPMLSHVKAMAGSWISGTTVVRVVQYGNGAWVEGSPVGDVTVATQ